MLPSTDVRLCICICIQDDQRILWEGVSSLTKQELQVSDLHLSHVLMLVVAVMAVRIK